MIKNPNKYRLLRVFEYMLQTDEEHPLNVTQIQNKLAEDGFCDKLPDRKSILRDLACINDCGYELESCANHNEGKYMNGKQRTFEGYQLKMLAAAVASARFLAADDARKLGDAIMTLGTESDKELLKKAVIRDESLNVATKQAKYNFDRILEAIRERKQISFQYNDKHLAKPAQEDLRNDGMIYYVSPYYLVPAKNDYYVIACTGEYKNFSHYRVSRMINVKETELAAKDIKLNETYKKLLADGKGISDYLREHINMWFGDTQRVNLHCKQR
ncbi:helix-turn-helix transcriptional regulator, partial [Phascolarctobacterium succinatutens]|uniref:helix-turn-helix transcriptional regulator n=1 Tax=Phascolarctobacterium succinatutens TaxID=626940 RepID=UPI0030789B80